MRAPIRRTGVIAGLVAVGLLGAPTAAADPSVPGDPTGQIYTPPGYIGYYPGVYGLQSIWSLTPPPRVRDAGGTRAMTNADPESSHVGLPGDRLGVQLKHVTVKPHEAGPLGQAFGTRPSSPMQQTATPEAAGGVAPGATAATGRQNIPTGQPIGLENPSPSGAPSDKPLPGLEARQPTRSSSAAPDTAN
ncbi:hypothetical protein MYCSP_03250 [Mycobacteroides saopaulense]|uniref:hypothetical protein n=1 Tax=Mycobacteroides saopaulense TaxID=1578165 RepID=UPI00071F472E|nr:hypothetical protein [Mycobacteroides saopaulense]ALR10645.1 hypothetical protein MYCSP_03250 [Mycobacteroides saopaulense]